MGNGVTRRMQAAQTKYDGSQHHEKLYLNMEKYRG
jgi:hypothetical protein